MIPYRLFFLLAGAMGSVEAAEERRIADGVLLGYALARAGKDNFKLKAAYRALVQRAAPESETA